MSADPLPLRRRRTPPPPAVATFLPVDVPGEPMHDDLTVARRPDSYIQELVLAAEAEALLTQVDSSWGSGDAGDSQMSLPAAPVSANDTLFESDPDSLETASSYVRIRPTAEVAIVQRFLEEIGSAQFTLTMRLYELERVSRTTVEIPSIQAAMTALATRVAELDSLRDALNDLYLEAAVPEVADALAQDGVFTEYLRGIYAWTDAVMRALEVLNAELRTLTPDWFRMRARFTDARDFYLGQLEDDVRNVVEALNRGKSDATTLVIHDLGNKVERVIDAARTLLSGVEKRFA